MSLSPSARYPRLFPARDQTIGGISADLRDGQTSCAAILDRCLAQIDEWEPRVHAWVVVDREGARAQARKRDEELAAGKDRGLLHGVPIGVKDIIDVAGLPTACGTKRWANRRAEKDADIVALLRHAGAVILGKTVTTPYAWIDPPCTRNPWNLERTPGGSSSGSAAAVACGMCLGAVGTQTGGSITRPASFCGVAGMKPTRLFLSPVGVLPLAPSLDHVGLIARSVSDLDILYHEVRHISFSRDGGVRHSAQLDIDSPPCLGRLTGFFNRRVGSEVAAVFDRAVQHLVELGVEMVVSDDPIDFEQILRDHRRVMAAEAAAFHSTWLAEFPDDYPPRIKALIEEGQEHKAVDYLQSKHRARSLHRELSLVATSGGLGHAFWITPATTETAPDPCTTGDPAFNSPWSYLGMPTVSFPIGLASDGLPVAMQLTGAGDGRTPFAHRTVVRRCNPILARVKGKAHRWPTM